MEIKDRTIALLIDSDNISSDYFAIILEELSQYGNVTYRRLYGDFTNNKANGWKQALLEYSIEQIQQIAFTRGKNATDSKMIIDAMDILYKGNIDCFCLATSDSDFTGLAMRFRNDNIVVIGAGEEKTPLSFRKACHRFIPIDEILKAKNEEKLAEISEKENKTAVKTKKLSSAEVKKKESAVIDIARKIVNDMSDTDGYVHFSAFMNEIYRQINDFNPRVFGAPRPIPFFKSLTDEKGAKIFQFKKLGKTDIIKLA